MLNKDTGSMSAMFDNIAPKYDFLNRLLSLGMDRLWRRRLARRLDKSLRLRTGDNGNTTTAILDVACGTGDLTIALARKGWSIMGVDISRGMVDIARRKCVAKGVEASFEIASADSLPFADGAFSAATISFGIRNFDRRSECIDEIFRVIAPSGELMILEFAVPRCRIWRAIYMFYFKYILPWIGGIISGNRSAYRYLPESVMQFPAYEEFCAELTAAGYTDVSYESLMCGVALLYKAHKP
jgi:demethylmenaquinone methyltransferase/2-methoxy-6-polyprenyl-1,4-benzoquinol methylase